MERLIGRAIAGRDDVVIVTKGGTDRSTLPPKKRFDAFYLRQAVERSLKRLVRDRIDVYLLHNPTQNVMMPEGTTQTLLDLRKEGKIGHWGVIAADVAQCRGAHR